MKLYQIQSSVLMLSGYATGKKVYKVSRMTETPNSLTTTPCGVCPVRKQVRIQLPVTTRIYWSFTVGAALLVVLNLLC
jgi:hypothetical protein